MQKAINMNYMNRIAYVQIKSTFWVVFFLVLYFLFCKICFFHLAVHKVVIVAAAVVVYVVIVRILNSCIFYFCSFRCPLISFLFSFFVVVVVARCCRWLKMLFSVFWLSGVFTRVFGHCVRVSVAIHLFCCLIYI